MVTSTRRDATIIDATQFPIKSVKLFSSGSAEITRIFSLSFLHSQDEPRVIEIVHLPDRLQSVDVSVKSTSGDMSILDHYAGRDSGAIVPRSAPVLKNPFTTDDPVIALVFMHPLGDSARSDQTLNGLEAERERLADEIRHRHQSFRFLTTYMDSLAQCKLQRQPGSTQMISFFDDFVDIGVARSAVIAELNAKLADVDDRITEEQNHSSKLDVDLPTKVVAVLSCKSNAPVEAAELSVTYVVGQVSWKPAYDLRIAMTGNTPSPIARLEFRCAVTQWTGENWANVSLALTTADQVSQLIKLPEPNRVDIGLAPTWIAPPLTSFPVHHDGDWHQPRMRRAREFRMIESPDIASRRVAFRPPKSPHEVSSSASVSRVPEAIRPRSPYHYRPPSELPEPQLWSPEIPPLALPESRPGWAEMPPLVPPEPKPWSSEMPPLAPPEVPKVDIPSQTVSRLISRDSKNPITHTAEGSIFIPSDHAEHHALVSSLSLQAEFMRVVVPSTDTRVYYTCEVKNTSGYVLLPGTVKTYLNDKHVSSTDIRSAELPQTLECSLAVDADVKTIHNHAPDALPSIDAFTGKATTTYTSATVVHNTHEELIRGVVVRSSVPLPADPRVTIVLKEPAGLAGIDEGSVTVKEGCLARWSTTGGRQGKQVGLFEWVCDVNPGTEVLKAIWEVSAPRDLKLFEQMRF